MRILLIIILVLIDLALSKAQTVTTVAGNGACGYANGTGTVATFNGPSGICTDGAGNIYVMDQGNNAVRKIIPTGVVSTFTTVSGMACGICIDPLGNLFVAATQNRLILKITPSGSVSTFAGSGQFGCADGTGILASFGYPVGICSDALGNIFVADLGCSSVRKITPGGVVTTYAGNGSPGFANGTSTVASFNGLNGVYAEPSGNIFVSDGYNHAIRKIDTNGMVSTIAGNGSPGFANGTGTLATFNAPYSVCGDNSGNIYVSEYNNHVIRKITPTGIVSTLAGNGAPGFANGTATLSSFSVPTGICIDNQGDFYVSEAGNCAVRKISIGGSIVNFISTQSFGEENEVILYPNPAQEFLGFKCLPNITPTGRIWIMNSLGDIVYKQNEFNLYENLDVSSFPKGSYILCIVFDEKNTLIKFLKE